MGNLTYYSTRQIEDKDAFDSPHQPTHCDSSSSKKGEFHDHDLYASIIYHDAEPAGIDTLLQGSNGSGDSRARSLIVSALLSGQRYILFSQAC